MVFFLHNNISICKNVTIKRGVTANNLAADAQQVYETRGARFSPTFLKMFYLRKGFPVSGLFVDIFCSLSQI